mgnify:CR=1 FL=1
MAKDVSIWVRVKDGFTAGLNRAKKGFKDFGAKYKKMAQGIAKGAGIIAAAMVKSVVEFNKFDKGMARVEALMGGQKESGLRREVQALAGEFGLASDELVSGLYNALSAGVPKGNVIEFLRTSAKAAVADGSDISTSVDGITTVLNAFKIESSEAGKVADVMFKTVALGKTNFSELSSTIATVAPLASASGVAFEEVFGAVATLTKQGTPTAQAMTQIRAALLAVNENLGDGWSETMTLQEAFGKLTEMAGGSSTELKKLMGRVEGVMGVLGITGANASGAAKDLKAMADASGLLDKAMEGSLKQAKGWDKLGQHLKGVWQDVGQQLTESMSPWLDAINEAYRKEREIRDNIAKGAEDTQLTGAVAERARLWQEIVEGGIHSRGKVTRREATAPGSLLTGAVAEYDKAVAALRDEAASKLAATNKEAYEEDMAAHLAAYAKHQEELKDIADANAASLLDKMLARLDEEAKAEADALEKKIAHEAAQEERHQARLAAARTKKLNDDLADAEKMGEQARAALFIDVPGTFKQGFDAFVGRRADAAAAQEDNTKLLKKVEDAKARQAKGIKRQGDAKLLADVAAFKKAEAMRKDAEDKILKVQEDIRDNLKENLEAAQKAV